jgi:hypothetical protein
LQIKDMPKAKYGNLSWNTKLQLQKRKSVLFIA